MLLNDKLHVFLTATYHTVAALVAHSPERLFCMPNCLVLDQVSDTRKQARKGRRGHERSTCHVQQRGYWLIGTYMAKQTITFGSGTSAEPPPSISLLWNVLLW
jgi:hypothetical protein